MSSAMANDRTKTESVKTDKVDCTSSGDSVDDIMDEDYENLLDVNSIKTAYDSLKASVSTQSLEGVVDVDSETDLRRKAKLHELPQFVVSMSKAYKTLLASNRKQAMKGNEQLGQLQARLDSAEERAKLAEKTAACEAKCKEDCKEDLCSLLQWVAGGHEAPPPELKTESCPDVVCCGEQYRTELSSSLAQVSEHHDRADQLKARVEQLERQLSDKEKRLREDRQHGQREISELERRVFSAEEDKTRLSTELTAAQDKEEQLLKALKILKEKLEPLQEEVEMRDKEIKSLSQSVEHGRVREAKLEQQLVREGSELRDKILEEAALKEDLRNKLECQNASLDQQSAALEGQAEALSHLERERDQLEAQLERTQEELEHVGRTIQEQSSARQLIETELSAQESSTATLVEEKSRSDREVQQLRWRLEQRESALGSLVAALRDLAAQMGDSHDGESPDDIITKQWADLDSSVQLVLCEVEGLRARWERVSRDLVDREGSLKTLRENHAGLCQEIELLQRRTSDLDGLVNNKEDETASLQETIASLQSELLCCRDNYSRVVEEKKVSEAELNGLHANTLEQCKFLQEQLNRRERTLEDITQQGEGLQEEYQQCCTEISSKQRSITSLEGMLGEKEEEILAVSGRLEASVGEKEGLRSEVERYRGLVEDLHKEMAQRETDALQDLNTVTSDYEALQKECSTVQDMLQEREGVLEEVKSSTTQMDKKYRSAQKEVTRHRKTVNSLEEKLKEAQSDFEHIQAQLCERDRELQACRQEAILSTESMSDKIRSILLELESLRLTKEAELSALQQECEGLTSGVQSYRDLLRSKDQQLQELQCRRSQAEQALSSCRLQCQRLEEEVRLQTEGAAELKGDLDGRGLEMEQQRSEFVRLQASNKRLRCDLDAYQPAHRDLQVLTDQLTVLPHQRGILGQGISNPDLKSQLTEVEKYLADMKSKQSSLEDQVKAAERALDKEKFQHNHLQDRLQTEQKKSAHTEARLQQVEDSGCTLKERLKEEQAQQTLLMDQCSSLQDSNSQLQDKVDALKRGVKEAQVQVLRAEGLREEESECAVHLREEVRRSRSQLGQLEGQLGDTCSQLQQSRSKLAQQSQELQTGRAGAEQREQLSARCSALEAQLVAAHREVEGARAELLAGREGERAAQEEVVRLSREQRELRGRLCALLREHAQLQGEVSADQVSDEESLGLIAAVLAAAETKFNTYVSEIRELRQEVGGSREAVAEAEEEAARLKNSLASAQKGHLITQKELLACKTSLSRTQDLSARLQEDCDSLAGQSSQWTREQRLSQEQFAERIRYLELEVAALQGDKQCLERQNGSMEMTNKRLLTQLDWANTVSSSPHPQPRDSSSVTHVQATLDLSIQHDSSKSGSGDKPSTSLNGSEPLDSRLQWQSQYVAAMKKGLYENKPISPPLIIPSKNKDEEMDKQFWMTRANQLALQLQQSTEFYTERLRLLSSQVEGHF